jgi:hypothetical protein
MQQHESILPSSKNFMVKLKLHKLKTILNLATPIQLILDMFIHSKNVYEPITQFIFF